MRTMKERYASSDDDNEFVGNLISGSINLLTTIYASIYFPTYSNGLKEIAHSLGFRWSWPNASGAAATILRRSWELSHDIRLKDKLVCYNREDCRAAELVANALLDICAGGASLTQPVHVQSLEVGFQRTFGKFDSVLPEFAQINSAAYWDYQRAKVYARTNRRIRVASTKRKLTRKRLRFETELTFEEAPDNCPRCQGVKFWRYGSERFQPLYDLKFSRRGLKRWVVKCRYAMYRCADCRKEITVYRHASIYGPTLRAFVVYLTIELRLSNQKAMQHITTLFDIPLWRAYDLGVALALLSQ